MNFLEEVEFNSSEIEALNVSMPDKLKEKILEHKKLVLNNLNYLKKIGIENYKDIYINFYDMFLLDYSVFTEIFEKYDRDDLIEKLKKSIHIVEYL